MTRIFVICAAVLGACALEAVAQPSGKSSANWVTGGTVNTVVRSGSTVYLGGQFNSIAPRSKQIGAFGSFVQSPGRRACVLPPINGTVSAIVSDWMGGYFIGGRFDRVGTIERHNLVHIAVSFIQGERCDVDMTWTAIVNGPVNALTVVGGVLYVGGAFTEAGQQGGGVAARSNLAAFSASGVGALTTWNPQANGAVFALEGSVSGGETSIYAGGSFTEVSAQPRLRFAVIDGAGLARPVVADANAPVYAMDLAVGPSSTHVWLGGEFTTLAGAARNRLAKISVAPVTGTVTVDAGFNPDANGAVRAVAVMNVGIWPGSTVYAGGEFTYIGGAAKNYVAALSSAGIALPLNPDPDGPVYALTFDSHQIGLFIGGRFSRLAGSRRLNAGFLDTNTGAALDWDPSFNGTVRAIGENQPAGSPGSLSTARIGVGGDFDAVGAERRNNLAAIDLDSGALLAFNPDLNGAVRALALRNDELYAGGDFTRVGATARNRLASFAAGTRALTSWDPNADGSVRALTWSGATIFAGGDFANVGSSPRGRIAAIDPTTGAVMSWTSPDFNATVNTIAVRDPFVYVGGLFTSAGGVPVPYLTRLSASTGARDATWAPLPNGEVRAICASAAPIYVGGVFTMVGTAPRANLAAIDGTTGEATTWQPDPNGAVNALFCTWRLTPLGGRLITGLYGGGAFTTVGAGTSQQTRPGLAEFLAGGAGPTGEYATSFRAYGLAAVMALEAARDGFLAGGTGPSLIDEEPPVARLAFFPVDFAGVPGPPTTPSVVAFAPNYLAGAVRLRWSPPVRGPRPTTYRIYAGSSPGAMNYANGFEVSGTQFDVGAPVGTVAYVRVHAVNAFGQSGSSEELGFRVTGACIAPPDPPQEVAVGVNGFDVTLTWTPSSGETVSSYRLEAGIASGRADFVISIPPNQSSFTVTAPQGVFYARVRAVGSCGTSVPSNEVVLATGNAVAPPTPPQNVLARPTEGNTVVVSWSAPAVGTATAYRFEAGSGFRASDLASLTTSGLSLSVSNVPAGTYYLRVFAIGVGGTSAASDEFIFVVP